MTSITKQIIEMIDMLPEQEQQLACEVLKRLVLAWDYDFTKVKPREASQITKAKKEIKLSKTVNHNDIDWDK